MTAFRDALRALVEVRAPLPVRSRSVLDDARAESAVLVVIAGSPPDARVLLVRRSACLNRHAGEFGFPGGVAEPHDRSPLATAIRETEEEVSLRIAESEVLGPLDQVFAGDRYVVSPFLAWVDELTDLVPAPEEIAEILTPKVASFLEPHRFRRERYEVRGRRVSGYAYLLDEGRVWGATARMLHGLFERADRGGVRLA